MIRNWMCWFVLALALYYSAAGMVFMFRHPWMTDAQRLMNFWETITWQKVVDTRAK